MCITKEQARQIIIAITKNATLKGKEVDTVDKAEINTLHMMSNIEWLTLFLDTDPNVKHEYYESLDFNTFNQIPCYNECGLFNTIYVEIIINLFSSNHVCIRLYTIKDEDLKTPIYDIDEEQMIFLSEYTLTDYDDIVEVLRSKLNVTI